MSPHGGLRIKEVGKVYDPEGIHVVALPQTNLFLQGRGLPSSPSSISSYSVVP